jgi:hypothetical protein
MSEKVEVYRQINQGQEKLTYYIIALCVTAIGFSIIQSNGLSFTYYLIPLGIAVLSWSISVLCGIRSLQNRLSLQFTNYELLRVEEGSHEVLDGNIQLIKPASIILNDTITSFKKKASIFTTIQHLLFYFGLASYLCWHILSIYLNTITS